MSPSRAVIDTFYFAMPALPSTPTSLGRLLGSRLRGSGAGMFARSNDVSEQGSDRHILFCNARITFHPDELGQIIRLPPPRERGRDVCEEQ
jgi:hypothetical protein